MSLLTLSITDATDNIMSSFLLQLTLVLVAVALLFTLVVVWFRHITAKEEKEEKHNRFGN